MRSKARNYRSTIYLSREFCLFGSVFLFEGLEKVGIELGYGLRNLEQLC